MVEAIRGYGVAGRAAARARTGGTGFRLPGAQAAPSEGMGAVAPLAAAGLLGPQDQASDAQRDAAARRRGGALLDALAELQKAMLSGRLSRAALGRMAALAEGEAGADPGLRDILDELSLRVRVELLRLGDEAQVIAAKSQQGHALVANDPLLAGALSPRPRAALGTAADARLAAQQGEANAHGRDPAA